MECKTIVEFAAYAQAGEPIPAKFIKDLRYCVGVVFMRDRVRGDDVCQAKITKQKRQDMRNAYIIQAASFVKLDTNHEKAIVLSREYTFLDRHWRVYSKDIQPRGIFNEVQKSLFFAKKIDGGRPLGVRQLSRIIDAQGVDI